MRIILEINNLLVRRRKEPRKHQNTNTYSALFSQIWPNCIRIKLKNQNTKGFTFLGFRKDGKGLPESTNNEIDSKSNFIIVIYFVLFNKLNND